MAIESMYVFTGDEVVATDLPAKLNENFAKTENNRLKTVNNVAQDENNNINVTELIPKQITSNTNLNNLVTSGEYTFTKGSATITNSPTPNSFFLTVLKNNALVKQVVTEVVLDDPITYTRVLSGSSWSPWVEGGKVKTINSIKPDDNGNVSLTIGYSTKSEIVDLVYPVGSLYWSSEPTSPATLFGGTWVQIKDKFILAAGDSYAQGATGGNATVALTVAEMPSHNHGASSNSKSLTGAIDTTDGNANDRRIGTGDATGILSSRESANVMRYGSGGLVTTTSGIKIDASHSHTITVNNTGSGNAHNNMPPYVTYYCWERTA